MLNLFKHMHYPNFLLSSSDLMQPCSWGFFSFWRYCQRVKRPWRRVWTLHLRLRLPLMQESRFLFPIWFMWKIGTVILFKLNMTEKHVCHTHTPLRYLDCSFSKFSVWTFYTIDDSYLQVKKRINRALSMHSKHVQTLCNLVPEVSSLSDVIVKK